MNPRFRRALALLVPALTLTLAACGGDESDTAKGFDAVEITGDAVPEVKWKAELEPGQKKTKVLEEGTGPALKEGDLVVVNFLLSNGYTHRTAIDTYGEKDAGVTYRVGAQYPVGVTEQSLRAIDLVTGLAAEEIKAGTKVGARIAITVGAEQAFGQYANRFGEFSVGNKDGLLLVADVEAKPLAKPDGKNAKAPAWAPKVVEKKGLPSGLTFDGLSAPKPSDALRTATLVKGTGEKVAVGDVVVANYLGQVHGASKSFDASFSRPEPLSVSIGEDVGGGATPVVKGWTEGLVGVPVGSRVIVQIPPKLGYGKKGAPGGQVKSDDTMYFLIDVLGAA